MVGPGHKYVNKKTAVALEKLKTKHKPFQMKELLKQDLQAFKKWRCLLVLT